MKKILLFFIILCLAFSSYATGKYTFTVKQSGKTGSAIILIPGFACSADVWNETVELLKTNHICYALTMPGFAGVPPASNPSLHSWAEEIASYIREMKLEKPVIIGHSMGGVLAQLLAADYPQLVSKIIIVDALPCLPALSNPAFEADSTKDCSGFSGRLAALSTDQYYNMQRANIASLVADTSKIETIVQWSMHGDRSTMGLIFCEIINTDLRNKISAIQCPTLVLLESNFKGLSDAIEKQYQNLKGAQLHYAGQGLHFIMYDDKDWYLNEVKKFIQ